MRTDPCSAAGPDDDLTVGEREGEREPAARGLLACQDCGRESVESERGWTAYFIRLDGTQQLVVLCPDCAADERGGTKPD